MGVRFESGILKMEERAGQGIGSLGSHFSSLVKHSGEPCLRTEYLTESIQKKKVKQF